MTARGRFGPGFLVAAAFIGPGTVTTASLAGAGYGFTLAWAVLAAVGATLILQEMAARLGTAGKLALGEALRKSVVPGWPRTCMVALALLAVTFGNAAYQAGNLTGASLGMEALVGGPRTAWVLICAAAAAGLLLTGAYRAVESVLIGLVALMSVVFVVTAVSLGPELIGLWRALARPQVPAGGGLMLLALIGTTVVPYNLFLHSAAVREKWGGFPVDEAVRQARIDTAAAVLIGGLVTLAILLTAVPLYLASVRVEGVGELARQLEPVLGVYARGFFAIGLFAAGLTSAITAPLAAAWATAGLLGWDTSLKNPRLRATWAAIIVIGAGFAVAGTRPLEAIMLAQAANGLLLPLVAAFLLWVMNRESLIGDATNGWLANTLAGLVAAFAAFLGLSQIWRLAAWVIPGS